MKKMFIALGIAFALICAAVVPSINAQIAYQRAKDAHIEAIENVFVNQFEDRYGAGHDLDVVNIEWHAGAEDGVQVAYYKVIFDHDGMMGSWNVDADLVHV